MEIGRFIGGIGALVWHPPSNQYLLMKRSSDKDYARDVWESVTGRLNQGEGFECAVHREVWEELGVESTIEFIIGTTHFYRGAARPENELIGVVYCVSIADPGAIRISEEHSAYHWVTAAEAEHLLTAEDESTRWVRRVIARAEIIRKLLPADLTAYYQEHGFELG